MVNGIASLGQDGTVTIPDVLNSAVGQVFTESDIPGFVARVQLGAPGLYGLQLATAAQAFTVPTLSVTAGQDVRIFSTASSSLEFSGVVAVQGQSATLTVRGLMTTLLFSSPTTVSRRQSVDRRNHRLPGVPGQSERSQCEHCGHSERNGPQHQGGSGHPVAGD